MKEFMLLIRNEIDHQAAWPPDEHQRFLKACESFIADLTKEAATGFHYPGEAK